MKKFRILDKYDRFVITRSDFMYKLPFPKMNLLDSKYIWIPDGEDYYGICDRTVVLSRQHVEPYVNILESFYKKSNKYYKNIESKKNWNMEQILKMHLEENNVFSLVQRYPYISYCIRSINGTTRWVTGQFSEKLGYYIKYPTEEQRATQHENDFTNACVSIDEFYAKAIKL